MADTLCDGRDYHQELMSAAYSTWQQNSWSYEEFVVSLEGSQQMAVVIGNLNYQTHNGGMLQWYDNGYHKAAESLISALTEMHKDCPLAHQVRGLVQEALETIQESDEVDESDYWENEEDDEDFSAWEAAEEESNSILSHLETLSDRYYEIADAFLIQVEVYLRRKDEQAIGDSVLEFHKEALEAGKPPSKREPRLLKKPRVKLIGEDGNAFAIIGRVMRALRKARFPSEVIDRYRKEATSADYDNVLRVSCRYADVY